eukprot:10560523-Lingulodinium_polyedra.AAC.1
MERVSARFAMRNGREAAIQPRRRATLQRRCAMARLNRRFAAAARRESRAGALHARTAFWFAHGA